MSGLLYRRFIVVGIILYCSTVVTVRSAPTHRTMILNSQPFFENPCGIIISDFDGDDIEESDVADSFLDSIRPIRLQFDIAVLHLKSLKMEALYCDVQMGVDKDSYAPTWIPLSESYHHHTENTTVEIRKMIDLLHFLHGDLQVYGMAFEEVFYGELYISKLAQSELTQSTCNDIDMAKRLTLLQNVMIEHKKLMCEVEMGIRNLAQKPKRVDKSIMPKSAKGHRDFTNRLIRDNEFVIRYEKYLSTWKSIVRHRKFSMG